MKASDLFMPTDMQYKDGLRKDKFINDLILKTLEKGEIQEAIEYLKQNAERIQTALEE